MNRAERIYRLHQLLRGPRPVPLQRLMEAVGASRATVIRDLGYLRDFFEAPLVYDREANGHHYDPAAPAFELPGLFFNESELFALLAAEQLLEAVQPGLLAPRLGPLKGRIRSLLKESGHAAETVARRILVHRSAPRHSDPDRFAAVAAAVLAGHVLEITYHSRGRDEHTQRRVHCARLIHYRDNWYLLAWCERAEDLRLFALERIRRPRDTGEPARLPDDRRLDRHIHASFGIFAGSARAWAVLRFSPEMARWVAEEAWHPDQLGQWRGELWELQVPYSDPREIAMEVMRYCPEVEVVAPPELRAEVRRRLAEGLQTHAEEESDIGRLTL